MGAPIDPGCVVVCTDGAGEVPGVGDTPCPAAGGGGGGEPVYAGPFWSRGSPAERPVHGLFGFLCELGLGASGRSSANSYLSGSCGFHLPIGRFASFAGVISPFGFLNIVPSAFTTRSTAQSAVQFGAIVPWGNTASSATTMPSAFLIVYVGCGVQPDMTAVSVCWTTGDDPLVWIWYGSLPGIGRERPYCEPFRANQSAACALLTSIAT